ncbi:unnamed protein product [Closterium sp. NIES-65]|nr:unnamed protein product [Closterium sp. NIES-65]
MASAQDSTASYVAYVMQGLSRSYNLLKRLSMAPSMRSTLNEDNLTSSYILQDEAMQEAERSRELLAQANFLARRSKVADRGNADSLAAVVAVAGSRPRSDSDDDDAKGGRRRSGNRRPRRGGKPAAQGEAVDEIDLGKGRRLLCWRQGAGRQDGVVLAGRHRGADRLAGAGGRRGLSGSGSSCAGKPGGGRARERLLPPPDGMKEVFVDLQPSGSIKHVRDFNGALQDVHGRGTVSPCKGRPESRCSSPTCAYVPGVRANQLSSGQLKEHGVKRQEDGDGMLLAWEAGEVLSRATYSNEVAIGLDLESATGGDSPCVSCVGGKLARHTFPDHGSDADDVLAVVHINPCRPFRVAAKDGSLYFMLLKDRKTRYVRTAWQSEEMRTVVESVGTMLLHMGVQHHLWHLALRQAVWVPPCPEQQRRGKLKPKARWGLHLGVSGESKGWELLYIDANRVVTTSDVVFYEDMSLEVWKLEHRPVSGRRAIEVNVDRGGAGQGAAATGEEAALKPTSEQSATRQLAGKRITGERSTRKSTEEQQDDERDGDDGGRVRRPPDFFVPAAFTTVYDMDDDDELLYDDTEEDEEFPELNPDMLADLEHRWDISTMTVTVKEALASWKGPAAKAAMEEEIRSLINMGTWELVERPPGVNVVKNRRTTSTTETVRVCKLLKSLYGLKQSRLLWYLALNDMLVDAGWKKSQVSEALYFKVGKDGVACWVLVYVDDLLAANSTTEMPKELKELLESAFEQREISPVQKYLDRRTPKTPVSIDAYAELTFDDEEAQERQEEEYRQKVGSLQFAATTTRPDIAFACSKLGSCLTVRSDQHWREG